MTRRRLALFTSVVAALTLVATLSAPAFPQDQETTDSTDTNVPQNDSTVEQILREQEDILRGRPFTYLPGGRRDPFRPLVTSDDSKDKGDCRTGIRCMAVNELDLSGIVKDRDAGDMALVIGPDNRGYFLRTGDQVFDGTVISVDSRKGTITFRQRVDDPRRIKPYRDVTKKLNPSDEEKIR